MVGSGSSSSSRCMRRERAQSCEVLQDRKLQLIHFVWMGALEAGKNNVRVSHTLLGLFLFSFRCSLYLTFLSVSPFFQETTILWIGRRVQKRNAGRYPQLFHNILPIFFLNIFDD